MGALIRWLSGLETQVKVILLLAVVGLIVIAMGTAWHLVNTAFEAAEDKGAVAERAEAQGKVIDNAIKAKAAADTVRRDGVPLADCLRDSRTPENC